LALTGGSPLAYPPLSPHLKDGGASSSATKSLTKRYM